MWVRSVQHKNCECVVPTCEYQGFYEAVLRAMLVRISKSNSNPLSRFDMIPTPFDVSQGLCWLSLMDTPLSLVHYLKDSGISSSAKRSADWNTLD